MSNYHRKLRNNYNAPVVNRGRYNPTQEQMRSSAVETGYTLQELRTKAIEQDYSAKKKYKRTKQSFQKSSAPVARENPVTGEIISGVPAKKKALKIKSVTKRHSFKKLKITLVSLGCLYLTFLIFGVQVTQYDYDSNGYVAPIKMSLNDVKIEKEYEEILDYYMECKSLYEQVLEIDFQLAQDSSQSLIVATKYEGVLDEIDSFLTQINSLSVKSDYTLLKAMLYNWCSDDIAVYLQNIADALTTNNSTTAGYALTNRAQMKIDFQTITDNFVTVGKNLKGVDISSFQDWTPDNYYNSLK